MQSITATPESAAVSHAGEVRIQVDQAAGTPPLIITIRSGDAPAIDINKTHLATVAVQPPSDTPGTAILLNQLAQGPSPAARDLAATTTIYENLDHALRDAFAADLQSIDKDVFKHISEEVNKIMAQLLDGTALMEIPADDIQHIQKELVAAAHLTFKSHESGSFDSQSLKAAIHKNPSIEAFEKKHKSPKSAGKDDKHPAHHAEGDHHKHMLHHHHQGTVQEPPAPDLELPAKA